MESRKTKKGFDMNRLVGVLIVILMSFCNGCSYLKRKGSWGKKALWPISSSRISEAFIKNIKSPHVWGPAAGAGAIHLSGYDKKISSWASEHNPIYGSQKNASNSSDTLNQILYVESGISVFLTPSWNGSEGDYVVSKLKGGTVSFFSMSLAEDFNNSVRKYVKRERPNGKDMRSLPSGHSTTAGASSAVLRKNMDHVGMDQNWLRVVNGLNTTLAAGVLWARVEAKAHYPTDVLMGYSVGNFISGLIFDSLMNLDPNEYISLYPNENKGMTLSYSLGF